MSLLSLPTSTSAGRAETRSCLVKSMYTVAVKAQRNQLRAMVTPERRMTACLLSVKGLALVAVMLA